MRCRPSTALVVITLLVWKVECFDYCTIKCGKSEHVHTMCSYPAETPGPNCMGYDKSKSTMTQEKREHILQEHNRARSLVAMGQQKCGEDCGYLPSAADMMEMVWNAELEEIAQRHALQCHNEKDGCRSLKDGTPCGQIVQMSTRDLESGTPNFQHFLNEAENCNKTLIEKYHESDVGAYEHYIQMIWANTSQLGCSISRYDALDVNNATSKAELLVCNYGPEGNSIAAGVYKIGEPCSSCPVGTDCSSSEYPGLCAVDYSLGDELMSGPVPDAKEPSPYRSGDRPSPTNSSTSSGSTVASLSTAKNPSTDASLSNRGDNDMEEDRGGLTRLQSGILVHRKYDILERSPLRQERRNIQSENTAFTHNTFGAVGIINCVCILANYAL